MTQNATKLDVAKKRENEKLEHLQEIEDLRKIVNLPNGAGIRFMQRLFRDCNMFRSSLANNNSRISSNEGARTVALNLRPKLIEASLDAFKEISSYKENLNG